MFISLKWNFLHFSLLQFYRKEDSTVYPHSLPITIPNLLNFVLANLNDDSKIEAMIYVCEVGIGEAPNTCLWRIRWLCLRKIESLSQELRKLRRNVERLDRRLLGRYKRIILLKLKHVREVHLILNFLEDLSTSSDKVRLLQKKFSVYYKRLSTLRHQSNKTRSDESGKSKRTEKPVKDELWYSFYGNIVSLFLGSPQSPFFLIVCTVWTLLQRKWTTIKVYLVAFFFWKPIYIFFLLQNFILLLNGCWKFCNVQSIIFIRQILL